MKIILCQKGTFRNLDHELKWSTHALHFINPNKLNISPDELVLGYKPRTRYNIPHHILTFENSEEYNREDKFVEIKEWAELGKVLWVKQLHGNRPSTVMRKSGTVMVEVRINGQYWQEHTSDEKVRKELTGRGIIKTWHGIRREVKNFLWTNIGFDLI